MNYYLPHPLLGKEGRNAHPCILFLTTSIHHICCRQFPVNPNLGGSPDQVSQEGTRWKSGTAPQRSAGTKAATCTGAGSRPREAAATRSAASISPSPASPKTCRKRSGEARPQPGLRGKGWVGSVAARHPVHWVCLPEAIPPPIFPESQG